jgi:hypothetical protein
MLPFLYMFKFYFNIASELMLGILFLGNDEFYLLLPKYSFLLGISFKGNDESLIS